ncbi:MAG: hypothetical protein AB1540_06030 [Bdellovibrionota bacterium]
MAETKICIPGLNVQWPWSQLILEGKKTIETRSYPLPSSYRGMPIAVIETPGQDPSSPVRTAQIIGIVIFSDSFQYTTHRAWLRDQQHHLVPEGHKLFGYKKSKTKWGWRIKSIQTFSEPQRAPKHRGIVFTKTCHLKVPIISALSSG